MIKNKRNLEKSRKGNKTGAAKDAQDHFVLNYYLSKTLQKHVVQ